MCIICTSKLIMSFKLGEEKGCVCKNGSILFARSTTRNVIANLAIESIPPRTMTADSYAQQADQNISHKHLPLALGRKPLWGPAASFAKPWGPAATVHCTA